MRDADSVTTTQLFHNKNLWNKKLFVDLHRID